jgi:hypothetical protein
MPQDTCMQQSGITIITIPKKDKSWRFSWINRGTSSRSRFRGLPQLTTVCRDYNNGKRNGEMGWSWISWIVTQKLTNNSEETKLLNCDSTWEQPLEAKEKLTKTKMNWSSPWSREAKVVSTWNLSKTDEPWTFLEKHEEIQSWMGHVWNWEF